LPTWARPGWHLSAVFEAPGLVAGLDDFAVMGQPIEQCGRHLRVAEYARPVAEREIGSDNDGGAFVKPADQMEEQLAASLSERQIAEFVEHDKLGERFAARRGRLLPAFRVIAGRWMLNLTAGWRRTQEWFFRHM